MFGTFFFLRHGIINYTASTDAKRCILVYSSVFFCFVGFFYFIFLSTNPTFAEFHIAKRKVAYLLVTKTAHTLAHSWLISQNIYTICVSFASTVAAATTAAGVNNCRH